MKSVSFAGFSGSGKTTLIEKILRELVLRGYRVSAVKDAHHKASVDHPGKDTWRFSESGASEVILRSGTQWALVARSETVPPLSYLLDKLSDCDLVLIEGFKHEKSADLQLEVFRANQKEKKPLCLTDRFDAVLTDMEKIDGFAGTLLDINDVGCAVDFILKKTGLTQPC